MVRLTKEEILPFQSHYVTVEGFRMHYLDEGSGPVVVLLHGNPTWCFYYRNLVEALRRDFRVIAPDYIGCGFSDKPGTVHFRAADRVRQVRALLDVLGIERFSLVMHDWGGPIGSALAVERPDVIDALVYLNTTLTETEALPRIIKLAATPGIGTIITKTTARFVKLTATMGVSRSLSAEVRAGYLYPYRSIKDRSVIWDFVRDIPFDSDHPSYGTMLQLAAGLPKLQSVPVKIIWGLKDPCFHREMLNKVCQHFPRADVVELPDASHLVLEDAPEIAIPAIAEFLKTKRLTRVPVVKTSELEAPPDRDDGVNALFSAFETVAQKLPREDAVIEPQFFGESARYTHHNFEALKARVHKYRRGLTELGLEPGDKVLFLVPAGIEFLALSYAVMAAGATPVFVDPGCGRENLERCIADTKPDAFIGSPKAHLLRILRPKLFRSLKFHVTVHEWLVTGGPNLSFLKRFSSAPLPAVRLEQEAAMIAFTSGATGSPKGVIFTSKMLAKQLAIFREQFSLTSGGKDCAFLPIFSLFHVALGVTVVYAPLDAARPLAFDPAKLAKIINELNVSSSFGSPTIWRKLAEFCIRSNTLLTSMRRVYMAGAPVSRETLSLVAQAVPHGTAYTPYGSTEALPVTLVEAHDLAAFQEESATTGEQGVFVGRPVEGVRVQVIARSADAIPDLKKGALLPSYVIGEIIVQGENVSPGYLHRLDANKFGKIRDGSLFWHRMGDVGYVDASGGVYLCGRKSHVVETPLGPFYPLPVERVFLAHRYVRRAALVNLAGAESVVFPAGVAIEPAAEFWSLASEAQEEARRELRSMAASQPVSRPIERFFFFSDFPVDGRHNAKIFRDQLSVWAVEVLNGRRKEE